VDDGRGCARGDLSGGESILASEGQKSARAWCEDVLNDCFDGAVFYCEELWNLRYFAACTKSGKAPDSPQPASTP
jgi:hypothetical protein